MTHRIISTTQVDCDAPGCLRRLEWDGSHARNIIQKVIGPDGWHLRPGNRHICPTCWDAGKR